MAPTECRSSRCFNARSFAVSPDEWLRNTIGFCIRFILAGQFPPIKPILPFAVTGDTRSFVQGIMSACALNRWPLTSDFPPLPCSLSAPFTSGKIFYHGLHGFHGWNPRLFLSVPSAKSVVPPLWFRLPRRSAIHKNCAFPAKLFLLFAPFAPVTFPIGLVARQPLSQLQIENFQFPILNSDVKSVVALFWLRLAALCLCAFALNSVWLRPAAL